MKPQKDSLEEAIRMIVRLQTKLAKEGIGLSFTWTAGPLPPPEPKTLRRVE
jgi:hypothetical protein